MKKYYKVYNYPEGYLVINFEGEEKIDNIDEHEIESILDYYFNRSLLINDITKIFLYVRSILKDYTEKEMFVSIQKDNFQKKVMYENKELVSYHVEENTFLDNNKVCLRTNFKKTFDKPFELSSDFIGLDYKNLSPKALLEFNEKIQAVMNEIFILQEISFINNQENKLELTKKIKEKIN